MEMFFDMIFYHVQYTESTHRTLCRVLDRLSFDRLSFDRLSFDRLSFDRLSFDHLSFDRLSFNLLSVNPLILICWTDEVL